MADNLERAAREVREQCYCMRLRRATRAVTQRYERELAESGIRATQFSLLVALASAPAVPLSKLAAALGMDRTTLSRNLVPLVRDGLVEEQGGTDRRLRQYALTARGKRSFLQALPAWRAAQAGMSSAMSAEQIQRFGPVLDAASAAASGKATSSGKRGQRAAARLTKPSKTRRAPAP